MLFIDIQLSTSQIEVKGQVYCNMLGKVCTCGLQSSLLTCNVESDRMFKHKILLSLHNVYLTVITVTILDDSMPEEAKTLIVQLRNPLGGAEVSAVSTMTLVILENDNVAGVLGFDTTAILAREGTV